MSYTTQIQALYIAYFNRPADDAGLGYWNSVLTANGGNLSVVSSAFAVSGEYTAKYAGMSPTQVVNQVYENLFGHAADLPGLQYWANLLGNGTLHIADIVTDIGGGAQGTDLTAYNNQVAAATAFTQAAYTGQDNFTGNELNPAATVIASEYMASVVANPTGASGSALASVLSSDLASAIAPANLQATTAAAWTALGDSNLAIAKNTENPMGAYDLSFPTAYESIDVQSATSGTLTFTNASYGTPLAIDVAIPNTTIVYQTADSRGSSESVNITLGKAGGSALGMELFSGGIYGLTLQDASQNGLATVYLNSATSGSNEIQGLTDNGLNTLNVSGAAWLYIGELNDSAPKGGSFTLNTVASSVEIGSFSDSNLTTLNFTGTGQELIKGLWGNAASLAINNNDTAPIGFGDLQDYNSTGALSIAVNGSGITSLGIMDIAGETSFAVTDSSSALVSISEIAFNKTITTESFTDTGSGPLTISADGSLDLSSLTLSGNVAYANLDSVLASDLPVVQPYTYRDYPNPSIYDAPVTTGITVSGITDNAAVDMAVDGAAAGYTDTFALGNGANCIVDLSTAGTVNVIVGNGSNAIDLGLPTANSTGTYNVMLGAHSGTSVDKIYIGTAGSHVAASTPNLAISGAATGDQIVFLADAASSSATLNATSLTAAASASAAVGALLSAASAAGAHGISYGVYGGYTYVVETLSGTPGAADTTIVELVGLHVLTAHAGYVVVAS